jgi:hypothetical protein
VRRSPAAEEPTTSARPMLVAKDLVSGHFWALSDGFLARSIRRAADLALQGTAEPVSTTDSGQTNAAAAMWPTEGWATGFGSVLNASTDAAIALNARGGG